MSMVALLGQSGATAPPLGWFHDLSEWWLAFYDSWGYTVENMIVAVILVLTVWLIWTASRNSFWRDAARRVFLNRRATISFFILCLYLLVAVFDSIRWRDVATDESGQPVRRTSGEPVLEGDGLSLLDRLDRGTLELSTMEETTYSAPLASNAFTQKSISAKEGGSIHIYPPLNHPGKHLLGTNQVGEDVLYNAIKSVRTGLIIGGMTTLLAIPFAIFFGIQAGYFGKWVDDGITYVYSTLASIPYILLIIAFLLTFGQGLFQLCLIMGLTAWTGFCRVIRGEVLKLREMDYVHAARAIGAGSLKIQFRHILPNVMHLVVIRAVLMFSGLVLAEAVLSYLNIGVGPGTMSWGSMINQGRFELSRQPIIWWNLVAAFVFMFGLVLPANIFGDAVRDALDPRLRGTE